jgi:hypothetical protein
MVVGIQTGNSVGHAPVAPRHSAVHALQHVSELFPVHQPSPPQHLLHATVDSHSSYLKGNFTE